MAASSNFDLSSGSPDRPIYTQRESYMAASLDRSGSFREKMENSFPSALPSTSRSSSTVTQVDVINFFQCLRFDPKSMATDHKFIRQGDFRRLTSVALGLPPDDSPSGSSKGRLLPSLPPGELKRLKAALRESSVKASERSKIFNGALSVINKCFPSIPSRKRSRSDVLCSDRRTALFPSDRSILGMGIGKMGTQSHALASGFELEQQKSEERTKLAVPNKRTRTSMVDVKTDVRANTPAKPSGNMDRDREMLRLPNSGAIQREDRTLSICVDGWEKSKMKKKRSGIKPDVSSSTVATKSIDGYRDSKQEMQPRLLTEARSRLNDSHGYRPGIANGAAGGGKADGTSQQTHLGMRSSIPRADQDSSALLYDRRDHPSGSDRERVNLRAVNKPRTNVREDFSSVSPTLNTKLNPVARAPRSGSGVLPKLSPVVQRSAVVNNWEHSHCTSKLPAAGGANNRKRTPSTQSLSPPFTHWAGQRPQKISCTARRKNFVPSVSSNDETPALETLSNVGNENGSGFARPLPSNSPQQVKLKGNNFSTAVLSENEESETAETKSRDNGKKSDEMDDKACQNVQKVSNIVLPSRNNKLVGGEDLGDGMRRQGRTGQGLTSTRSPMPMTVEKHGPVRTAKQLRSARLGFDKTESKAGRPANRKPSARKAYMHQKHTTVNAAADFLGSDDGHEQLLAAAKAVINPTYSLSSSFWRQMEPYFRFISDADVDYLRQQGNLGLTAPTPTAVSPDVDGFGTVNGFGLIEPERNTNETESVELIPENLEAGTRSPNDIPLYQRLIAALISEEGNEELCCSGNEDLKFDVIGSILEMDSELKTCTLNYRSSQNFQPAGCADFSGYRITATGRSLNEMENNILDNDIVVIPETGIISNLDLSQNGLLSDQAMVPGIACSEFQYDHMSISERLLLEIQNIGLYPEPVPDLMQTGDEEISEDISRLEDKYHEKVSKKKGLLGKLLKVASNTRELQAKEFEQSALDMLVAMAYEKYMTCLGPHANGGKSASSKMAKQAALAFVKRTLERCQKFEDTGKSCFSEPLFRDMLLPGSSHLNDAQPVDTAADGESGKQYVDTSSSSPGIRVSAPMCTQQSPSLGSHGIHSSDVLLSVHHTSKQTIVKEDTWSDRVKKKKLLLDDVGGTIGTTSTAPSGIGKSPSNNAKGKKSERDREGKGNSREVFSRNGTAKIGRPASCNVKGERKSRTKPKQKTTQLSASVNSLGKISERPKAALTSVPKSSEIITSDGAKETGEFRLDVLEDPKAADLSNLQLPGMNLLGVPDDLGCQGQDIDSWLNIDDDGLQDHDDFMGGLQIPMDDLSDLNMMV